MIPGDLAARLRLLAEASFFSHEPQVPGLSRVREIRGQLPDLQPGERFTATLQRALPDGTFQAVVAGRTYTLALGHAANPGDTLELVVTRNSSRAVFAERAAGPEGAAAQTPPASATTLSAAGRLIGFLLTGQPTPPPAALGGGQPLLAAPPADGAALAPLLREALGQSGLFYEAHQAQWVAGEFDAGALAAEPQGREAAAALSAPAPSAHAGTPALVAADVAPPGATAQREDAHIDHHAAGTTSGAALAIPERLLPVVHQQLDVLATQQLVVHTQAWPGQSVQWEIEDEGHGADDGEDADGAALSWKSTLKLTLPGLGGVEARLHLTPAGVAVRLLAGEPTALVRLGAGHDTLAAALAAADVPLTGFVVEARRDER